MIPSLSFTFSTLSPERRFLLWFTLCAFIAVLAFTQGFFLVRYEVQHRSSCDMPLPHLPPPPLHVTGSCWRPAQFRRAVVIIFDGMRYDFLAWNDSLPLSQAKYYQNKMPFVRDLVQERRENTFVFRFIADAPTTTSQRLKGIWTGGMPTFLDLKDNFNSAAIDEDNLLLQLILQGHRDLVFMGGDTWDMLFPGRFVRSYALPSFNVKDLHTVDDGIERHLEPELRGERGEWEVMFVHFEGVDHVGHRHGPDHPAMQAKLTQMDGVLRRIVPLLTNDTVLLVMSDHGMTSEGNHGGASDDEMAAVLFVYSPRPINSAPAASALSASQRFAKARAVPQVDIVPTLSLLLGVPIPYASLGALIPELFLATDLPDDRLPSPLSLPPSHRSEFSTRLDALNWALHVNARQVWQYLSHYSTAHRSLPLAALEQRFHALMQRVNDTNAEALFDALRLFLTDALCMCRQLWTAFDEPLMVASVILSFTFLVTFLLFIATSPAPSLPLQAMSVAALFTALPFLLFHPRLSLPAAAIASALILILHLLPTLLSLRIPLSSLPIALCLILHAFSLFSNSFIEAEHSVLLHLMLLVEFVRLLSSASAFNLAIISILATRASVLFTSEGRHEALSVSVPYFSLASCLAIPLILYYCSIRIFNTYALNAPSIISRPLRILLALSYASCAAHHTLQLLTSPDSLPVLLRILFPRLIYASIAFLILLAITTRPPLPMLSSLLSALLPVPLFLLLLGPHAPLQILLLVLQLCAVSIRLEQAVVSHLAGTTAKVKPTANRREGGGLSEGIQWAFLCGMYFYSTGHAQAVSALQMESAYYGLLDYHWLASSLLVFCNTFSTILIAALALPLFSLVASLSYPRMLLGFALAFTVRAACTIAFVYVARRHLMVWRVFAPKFLFDSAFLMVALVAALLVPYPFPIKKE